MKDGDKIRYGKSQIENYYFVMKMASRKLLEVDNLEKQYGKNSVGVNEEIAEIEKEITLLLLQITKVDMFLQKLSTEDRLMIYNLHKKCDDRKHYRDYCFEVGMSKSTLQRYVNDLILEYWEF